MKRRDVEIIQKDGRILVLLAREQQPLDLDSIARDEDFQMAGLCLRIGVSERHLRRVFVEGLGIGPKEWLRQQRMVAARHLLRFGSPIKEVAIDLGFPTAKMFSRDFMTFHGVRPTDFQRKESGYSLRAVT
ncbi:MAG: helix-turn-helix domain-containing protein [Akkermansiaceae bacterium]|nr:helix-turn-helix domain-containing protein [Akkermansiaceae bacterium]MCF7731748.1 helix-turn-helix domain-containing protein [Akkermansiaceae bacterium]